MRRTTRRHTGRPPALLRTDVHDALLQHLANGVPTRHAAAAVGIGKSTFYRWWNRGEAAAELHAEGHPVPPREQPFWDFWDAATRARAKGQAKAALLIMRAAQGGYVLRERSRTYRDRDGKQVTEVDRVFAPVDWRAAAWWLERVDPEHWSRPRQLRVESGGPASGDMSTYKAMAERLHANLQRNHEKSEVARAS